MRITAARVVVTSPGRNFVTLKIETDEGVHGIGDDTLNGRELAVAALSVGGLGGTGHVATLEEIRANAARGTAEVSA